MRLIIVNFQWHWCPQPAGHIEENWNQFTMWVW